MPRRRRCGKARGSFRDSDEPPRYNGDSPSSERVNPKPCPHCGKQHRPETRTCPFTGKAVDQGPANASANKTIFGLAAPPPLPMPSHFGKPGDAPEAGGTKVPEAARKTNPPRAAAKSAASPVSGAGPAPSSAAKPTTASAVASKPSGPAGPALANAGKPVSKPAAPAASAPKPSPPNAPNPAFAKTLFMSGPPPSRPSPSSVASPAVAPAAPSPLAAAPAEPAGATPQASSDAEMPSEIPIVLDVPAPNLVAEAPSLSPEADQPMLTMEGTGNQSRTILLQDSPVAAVASPATQAEAQMSHPDLATVRFDLSDLTPVDAAPVALLMASRAPVENHEPPAAPRRESPAQQDAPKPRMEPSPKRGGVALRRASWLMRALTDGESAMRLLIEAAKFYGKHLRAFALLMLVVLLPMVATKSCLVAASTGSVGTISTTVDLSHVKEDLTRKAQASKAQGKVDKAALAELAALETVAATAGQPNADGPSDFVRTARWVGAALLTGILMLGLAIPLGYAVVAMLLFEHTASARWPSLFEILNRLWRRRLPLGASLLPAALIVALGSALLMLPGLVAAALFLFVPAIVIFERSSGKDALARSLRMVRADGVRVLVIMLATFVVGAAAYLLAGEVMPESPRRIHVFLRLLLGDGLMVSFFPISALAVARLYLEQRAQEGETPAALAHASRR